MNYKNMYNNTLRKNCVVALVFAVTAFGFSCKKIDDVQSTHLQTEAQAWKSVTDARTNLIGIYGLMRSALASDNTQWLTGDLRNGDFVSTSRADLKAIIEGRLNASYPIISNISNWRRFYAVINACNIFIERSGQIVANDARYTKINNQVDVAQAKTLRAMTYFYMVRIWGDVPLLTSSNDGQFPQLPRTAQERVLSFCKTDLMDAAQVLPFRYGSDDVILPGLYFGETNGQWQGVTFTRISAYCLLAHIAAWQQNYIDCEVFTKFIIDNYPKVAPNNASTIRYLTINELTGTYPGGGEVNPFAYKRLTQLVGFTFEYGFNGATTTGHIEELTLAKPLIPKAQPDMYVPKDSIKRIFTDPKDLRFGVDEVLTADARRTDPYAIVYQPFYFTNYSSERPLFSKIKVIENARTQSDFVVYSSAILFTRLEEITLLRAEALAVLGQRTEAIDALAKATALRGTAPYLNTSTKDLLTEIFAERRRELMGEGWRWYDIIRYNRIKNPSGPFIYKNGTPLTFAQAQSAGAIYWPVSEDVIKANPAITQNAYWQ